MARQPFSAEKIKEEEGGEGKWGGGERNVSIE
jgi:hypothetical protein